jgi:hypothetical protein
MKKIDISFILPSNRNHNDFSNRVIENINSLNFGEKKHEIIVVSPNYIQGENVTYIEENHNNRGCVGAYNLGYKKSNGDYIILCSDDHFFDLDSPKVIEILKSELFSNKKFKIVCLPTNHHSSCPLPDYTNVQGIIARYPVFERNTVENYMGGYIYHPEFRHHYPDNWLGYWMSQEGETTIEISEYNMITFNSQCDKSNDDYDENVFKKLIKNYISGYKNYI